MLYDSDGNPVGTTPVDSSTTVWLDGGWHDVSNADDLTTVLIDSGRVHACFARNTLRFSLGRMEHEEAEGCTVEALGETLASGLTLDEFLVQVALLDEFTTLAAPGGTE